jgi:glucose/arabinose dehydrogenase
MMTIVSGMRRASACVLLILAMALDAHPATLPGGFSEALVASGLNNPTAMQFAPDGRLFVCEQGGRLRVIKNGALLSTPFLTVTVSSSGERGLLGVAFDPNFTVNQYVYVYYTATSPAVHNRISRFTASGDVAVAGSEVVVLDLDNLSSATNHNGGALNFGPDGKLYAAAGENANAANAQTLANLLGKVLRLNSDGTIPTDNPFYATATGRNRAIWALGLRNPFTFAFSPSGSSMFINDVGQTSFEEINDGAAGANYGWPDTEGATSDPRFDAPRHSYAHASGACAIVGGAFYMPATTQFPSDYVNDYFFADYCAGWIRRLDPANGNAIATFATGIASPVDLKVADDGSLYYLARVSSGANGVVYRVTYGATAPAITSQPSSRSVAPGTPVTFSVRASGPAPLRYQWQRNGANISGATAQDYTLTATSADNGARFRAVVSNDFGSTTSAEAVLTVTSNTSPVATMTAPATGTLYSGGSTISFAGTATDAEDGTLPASAFTWRVDFHHDTHTHPFMASTSGIQSGTFTIPTSGETSANVWYRIYLTVRDAAGATHTVQRDVLPRKVTLTLATSPAGLQLELDGQPIATPASFSAVVGIVRTLEAPAQTSGTASYEFASWSDGGTATHTISTPATNTTYTATFRQASGGGTGLSASYFDNIDFTGTTVVRTDSTIDFAWGSGSPAATIAADTFSARWTGQLEAPYTGTYTFYTVSDDGVKLWVNGVQLVNHWSNHAAYEDRGTISLTAGQRYSVRMEYYENGGSATARLLWSHASIAKSVVPASRLYPAASTAAAIRINFQPASAPVPAGYLPDGGLIYGARANGQTYGWNADNTGQARDRNSTRSPDQAYDTLTHMQLAGNPNASWEIAVANGTYDVRMVSGDASNYDSVYRIAAEGIVVVSGTPTTGARWIEGSATVTVTDGRLTLTSASGSSNNKICFIEITPR